MSDPDLDPPPAPLIPDESMLIEYYHVGSVPYELFLFFSIACYFGIIGAWA